MIFSMEPKFGHFIGFDDVDFGVTQKLRTTYTNSHYHIYIYIYYDIYVILNTCIWKFEHDVVDMPFSG